MQDFLSLNDLNNNEILNLVQDAIAYKEGVKELPDLSDKTVANLFFEPSTRTSASFYQAELKTKVNILNIDITNLSTQKGETLKDTIQIFDSLKLDGLIIRHNKEFYYKELLNHFFLKFINAGDGKNEHPSQALLDLVTIYENFGKLEGLKVLIAGDIKHSRVAHSNVELFKRFGMDVKLVAPDYFKDEKFADDMYVDIDKSIGEVDVCMLLRVQNERHESEIDSKGYLDEYGLNIKRYSKLKDNAIVMHPGPYNLGVEIEEEVAYGKQSRIWEQVTNGLYTRIAILSYVFREDK